MAKGETVNFFVRCPADYAARMRELSADGRCWIGDVVFGKAHAIPYDCPSEIPGTAKHDSPPQYRGYWRDGQLHEFCPTTVRRANRLDNRVMR